MDKLIHNKLQGVHIGNLIYSKTSNKLYMIIKLETEKYSLLNLDTGNIDYYNFTKEEMYNLTKELIYINNKDCKIEIKY